MRKISWRTWVSIITAVIIIVVLVVSRKDLMHAWELMHQVNIWLLLGLLVPLQFLSYYAMGETLFSYLRSQGQAKGIHALEFARLTLEMNFVNHVLPSAGVSGMSYMGWRLRHFGVSVSKSTTAQLVRIVATFGGFAFVLVAAVLLLWFDGTLNRWVSLVVTALVAAIIGLLIGMIYMLENKKRLPQLARWIVKTTNRIVRLGTFGRVKRKITSVAPLEIFFEDIRKDYRYIRANKHVLIVPFLWGVAFTIFEIAMFYAAFAVLGHPVNPAALAVAWGLAGAAAIFMVTPGGAGIYELAMVGFLTVIGVDPRIGIAGIVLTRVILMVGTIIAGYYFYQQALMKHGKRPASNA